MVLNEEKSNLHEGKSAAEDGPNLSSILDSDRLWITPFLGPLLSEGEHTECMKFVTDLLLADPLVDFADESSATAKVGGEVVFILLLLRLGRNMRSETCVARPRVRVVALVCVSALYCHEGISPSQVVARTSPFLVWKGSLY